MPRQQVVACAFAAVLLSSCRAEGTGPATTQEHPAPITSESPGLAPAELPRTEPPAVADQGSTGPGASGCRSDPAPLFTHPFTDLSMITFISPIGTVTHSVVPHSYVWIGSGPSGGVPEVPVYAPVDSRLTSAAYYSQLMLDQSGEWVDIAQYALSFEVSCEVSYRFAHIDRVAEVLAAAMPAEPADSSRGVEVRPPVQLRVGELIGYTAGTIGAHNWDFGVYNRAAPNQFANQARYETTGDLGTALYANCPYDYFTPDLRDQMYALLPEGGCGSASRDVPGSLAGTWFAKLTSEDFRAGPSLAVGLSHVPGGHFVVVVSEGAGIRVYPGEPTFVEPALVTEEHCYQGSSTPTQYAFFRLLSDLELAVAFGEGTCPLEFPQAYKAYYR